MTSGSGTRNAPRPNPLRDPPGRRLPLPARAAGSVALLAAPRTRAARSKP